MKIPQANISVALLAGLIVSASFNFGLFTGWEYFLEDSLVSPKPIDKSLVIVAIDNESITRLGQWPWPREIFAKALLKMQENSPAAVGLDVVFSEPSRIGAEDDFVLAKALAKVSYPVVLAIEAKNLVISENRPLASGGFLLPIDNFRYSKNVFLGHVNLMIDKDGIVRKFPFEISPYKSFSYEIVKKSGITISGGELSEAFPRIVFSVQSGSVQRIPFWRVLEGDAAKFLENKIVLIGATAPDLHDEKPTPFSQGTEMPGVEIQANIANMLVSGYRYSSLNRWVFFLWIFMAALIPALFFIITKRSLVSVMLSLFVGFGHLIAVILLFDKGITANIIHINFSWIFSTALLFSCRYFFIEKEKRQIRNIFSKYVSKEVLENILSSDKVTLGGEEKEITVLFSDIRGFTSLSEKTTPTELVAILNKYFTLMTGEILKNKGVLDKYIGDAIMAFWGAPLKDENQADNAIKASLGMIEKLKDLNRELISLGKSEINIGIGLYSGPAVVGNVGSELRFDYTAMGDTVNVASRLESLNKEYRTQLIVGESVKNKAKENYNFKFLGKVSVKGRKEEVNIYEVQNQT
ncbi:MAG: adenylate/guanylate cyclase domain-containing protein [Candidatus Azambacteria bacterium]|nr:adenylate/guanylate cyclase domain-containing protein [Candidatus Azambacteria bacterium]